MTDTERAKQVREALPIPEGYVRAIATRACIVRDALRAIACAPENQSLHPLDRELAWGMATAASDETLAKLGRMLR